MKVPNELPYSEILKGKGNFIAMATSHSNNIL